MRNSLYTIVALVVVGGLIMLAARGRTRALAEDVRSEEFAESDRAAEPMVTVDDGNRGGGGVPAGIIGPDVIVYDVGVTGGDSNDIHYYGQNSGIAAYSIATQSCNMGDMPLDWYDSGNQPDDHPVIGQNMFRYNQVPGEPYTRLEQIGQSWLKHGFCAVNETESQCGPPGGVGTCQGTNCDTLGVGCADTYWATLNDGGSGRSKTMVNAATGAHVGGGPSPAGNSTIRGRIQVLVSEIDPGQNPGAEYFIESQYVAADDADWGNAANNASWRRITVNSNLTVNGGGPTQREDPGIYAWQDQDPSVKIEIVDTGEDGPTGTLATVMFLGYAVTDLGGGQWRYEYAIQNLTSDQSAKGFRVPIGSGVNVTDIYFRDVPYHSGDPYDGTDWAFSNGGAEIGWATDDFNVNVNANAVRWGTMYNFGFTADGPPVDANVAIDLFKPGVNSEVLVSAKGPDATQFVCPLTVPPFNTYTTYKLTGPGNGTPWSWRIESSIADFSPFEVLNVGGVDGTTLEVAQAFAASINSAVVSQGCSVTSLLAVGTEATIDEESTVFLSLATGNFGGIDLFVGPAGSTPTCLVGTRLPACGFNPTIEEVFLSGEDCNENGLDDELDIATGSSEDCNNNGVPDECEGDLILTPPAVGVAGPRYLAVTPVDDGVDVAIRVRDAAACFDLYAQAPVLVDGFNIAELDAAPVYLPAATWGTTYVADLEILPLTDYIVGSEAANGPTTCGGEVTTWIWGDTNNSGGTVNFDDVVCVLDGFAGLYFGGCS
ncbi:MAG: hypothetical protein IID36_08810, partial [Planctomycetes bacterium]|nr:hypothetical protein [Planctomycetota bacterium]